MKDISVINIQGKNEKPRKVDDRFITPERINRHTIFEVVNSENQNKRQGTHKTKNKAEVSGTGKKPYKQKHTGRARQGSKRNPHFRGGGVVFGPTPEKNYKVRVNKKVFKIALVSVWFKIIESGKISILSGDTVEFGNKTKGFIELLKKAQLEEKKLLVIINDEEKHLARAIRNIDRVTLRSSDSCSVRDLLNQEYLLITDKALEDTCKKFESWK